MIDKCTLHATKIVRIVHDSGPRLVILVKGRPVLYRPDTAAARKHYAKCASIVGTYAPGVKRESIADDLRSMV